MTSLPSRERGLKFATAQACHIALLVAPLAGAWIEICKSRPQAPLRWVAPLAGAWIEIVKSCQVVRVQKVAPLAGAWIEIQPNRGQLLRALRRSPRGSVD